MKFRNEDLWNEFVEKNSDDMYGSGILRFATNFAKLAEEKIEAGAKLEGIAKETWDEADTEGFTGFMYSMAIGALAMCWEYGEELRRWHNLEHQLGDEGERANDSDQVLNIAILNIAVGDD